MLSEQSTPVIRTTLPVVGAAIGDIAELFYAKLFDDRPELLRDLFNRGNQDSGEQQKALAGSIAGFASMLVEHPEARPDAMLARIANKHASLGITSDQYKLVHQHLFSAIGDVLGEAVTEEVAAAWDEVYWLMANALIAIEARLYQSSGTAEGEIWHQMEIAERREETPTPSPSSCAAPTAARRAPSARASTSASRSNCPTVHGRYASTAFRAPRAARSGASPSSASVERRRRRARSPPGSTSTPGWATVSPSPPRSVTLSCPKTTGRCCWRPPAWVSHRCWPCSTTSPPRQHPEL